MRAALMSIGMAGALLLATPARGAAPAREVHPAGSPRDRCERWRHQGLPSGPVTIGYLPGDLGTGRRACPRSEVSLWLRGAGIIDAPNFYGAVAVSGLVSGSLRLADRAELFGTWEVVEFQFVQNATLKGTAVGLGSMTIGGSYALPVGRSLTLTPYARALLPTGTLSSRSRAAGGEAGLALSWNPIDRLELHGVAALDLTFGLSAGPAQPRGGALVVVGVTYAPWTWLGIVLDLQTHLGYRAPLDYLAPALALRFRAWRGLNLELGGTLPVVGADRRDFLAVLRLGYRW